MFVEKAFSVSVSVNFVRRCLPLSSNFKIHLQKGSVLCISQRIGGGDAFFQSVFDVVLTFVGGMVSAGVYVLLWVWVAGQSGVDVTKMLMEAVEATELSLTSTNHEMQSAPLLWASYPFKGDVIGGQFQ